MRRGKWFSFYLLVVTASLQGGWGTDNEPPPLPADRLPAKLPVGSIPAGLDRQRPIPDENPLTEAKVRLGRQLFFDPVLSRDHTISCASCHRPEHGLASDYRVAVGIAGKQGRRNAPSLLNIAYATSLFWDGRLASLEEQALRPIEDPNEMGNTVAEVLRRLRERPAYRDQFQANFRDGVTASNLAKVLACFQRVLLLGDSRVDRFRAGDVSALNAQEKHGLWLFESRGRCWQCHSGATFTDDGFHNTGVSWGKAPPDLGRYNVTKEEGDKGKFKTPSLRGAALTPPYMHDGSLRTLEEVVEFYNRGGGKNPQLDSIVAPLGLTADEIQDLVAFLKALAPASASELLRKP